MFLNIIAIVNILFVFIIIFEERNNARLILIWAMTCILFPIFGFIYYVVFGNKLKFRAKQKILKCKVPTKYYLKKTNWYKNYEKQSNLQYSLQNKQIFNALGKINIWHNNNVEFFYDGTSFFDCLIKDINLAEHSINIMFYIISDDSCGHMLLNALKEKARQGIKINVIYDAVGSRKTNQKFWQKMKMAGIEVVPFFPPLFKLDFLNLKLNYRNHKKIVVIDGKVAYTGGINIRSDHMGNNKKLSPWRDSHARISGSACYPLQDMFLNDLSFSLGAKPSKNEIEEFFPIFSKRGDIKMSILENSPCLNSDEILNIYKKIIDNCKKTLIIQTPYFIVERDIIKRIIDAQKRGVDVTIMLPKKPDKKFVYFATIHTIKPLIENNIKINLYNGFLHAKTLITENFFSLGSCNFDNRSFYLNFESTCLFYDKKIINQNYEQIKKDMQNSQELSKKQYKTLARKGFAFRLLYLISNRFL